MLTLQCKLELNTEDKEKFLSLMRRYSSCLRYAYNRLIEGKERKELRRELQKLFNLNSRYVDSAIYKAEWILKSVKEIGENPKKVIFGGKALFEKLKRNHLTGKRREELRKKWREKRQGTLYSLGEKDKSGNLNLRFILEKGLLKLRINLGNRDWIYAGVNRKVKREKDKWIDFIWRLEQAYISGSFFPYSVELKLRDGEIYAFVSFEEKSPEISLTKENGVIGLDLNASPLHISWACVSKDGNLQKYGKFSLQELLGKTRNQREYILWHKAYEVIKLAKEEEKALSLERLYKVNKGYRGDGKGKLRKRLSNWVYKSLIEKIKALAKRNGVEVIEVSPAYSSVIGTLKYCPTLLIDKDTAGAYVIGRRALGFKERLPKNYLELLKDKEFVGICLQDLWKKKEELKEKLKTERNAYKRNALKSELRKLVKDIKRLQSLYCQPETQEPVNRGKEQVRGKPNGFQKLWQVVKIALLIPFLGKSFVRDFSPLRRILVSRDWERVRNGLAPVPGAGTMASYSLNDFLQFE